MDIRRHTMDTRWTATAATDFDDRLRVVLNRIVKFRWYGQLLMNATKESNQHIVLFFGWFRRLLLPNATSRSRLCCVEGTQGTRSKHTFIYTKLRRFDYLIENFILCVPWIHFSLPTIAVAAAGFSLGKYNCTCIAVSESLIDLSDRIVCVRASGWLSTNYCNTRVEQVLPLGCECVARHCRSRCRWLCRLLLCRVIVAVGNN